MDSFHADHSDICVAAVRGCGHTRPEAEASVMVKTAKKSAAMTAVRRSRARAM